MSVRTSDGRNWSVQNETGGNNITLVDPDDADGRIRVYGFKFTPSAAGRVTLHWGDLNENLDFWSEDVAAQQPVGQAAVRIEGPKGKALKITTPAGTFDGGFEAVVLNPQ